MKIVLVFDFRMLGLDRGEIFRRQLRSIDLMIQNFFNNGLDHIVIAFSHVQSETQKESNEDADYDNNLN